MVNAKELFDLACDRVLERFKLVNFKDLQRKALEKLVDGEDVFVIQPTGSGKSLIFQSAPMVFDSVSFGVSAFLKFIFINVIFLGTIWRTP